MDERPDLERLVGRTADQRLLDAREEDLPAAVGRPPSPPPSRARGRIVGLGATLTGVTLIAGIALVVFGAVEVFSHAVVVLAIATLGGGVALVATHWGWVHVAEATADSLQRRREGELAERRGRWLQAIEPYARHEVATEVQDDGSIRIARTRFQPVPLGERWFAFKREVEHEEVHPAEEPSAQVAERAELLRHQAAADTERERERFEAVRAARDAELLAIEDSDQRAAARRAAAQALSERINSNLRDPPLVE